LCISDEQYWRKFSVLPVSLNGGMIHFEYQVFHPGLRNRSPKWKSRNWAFFLESGRSRSSN